MPYANLTFKTLFSNALQKPETLCRFRIPDLSLVFSIALTEFSDDDEFLPPPCICSAPYVCIKYINYIVARFNVRSKQRLLCFTSIVQSQFQTQWSLRCKKSEIQGIYCVARHHILSLAKISFTISQSCHICYG